MHFIAEISVCDHVLDTKEDLLFFEVCLKQMISEGIRTAIDDTFGKLLLQLFQRHIQLLFRQNSILEIIDIFVFHILK